MRFPLSMTPSEDLGQKLKLEIAGAVGHGKIGKSRRGTFALSFPEMPLWVFEIFIEERKQIH